MSPVLPDCLERYFAAQNAHDVQTMVRCFAPDAAVRDEGRDYVGHDEISAWKAATIARYAVQVAPLEVRRKDGRTIVTARVAGNFPGSPADLTYDFGLSSDGLIRTLEIG